MEFDTTFAILAGSLAILGVPSMLRHRRTGRGRAAIRFSSTANLRKVRPTLSYRLWPLLPGLRILAFLLLLVAFARPRKGDEYTEVKTQGVAIQMVADRSSSMVHPENDLVFEDERMSRLEVVKRVFPQFVTGDNDQLPGRSNDLIGLTTFARYAEEECPLTLDHVNLVGFVESLVSVTRMGPEDGTSIGDGIYHAALSLIVADEYVGESLGEGEGYQISSKVIILLTDGEWTESGMDPIEAAKFASDNGIKIYTIAILGNRLPLSRIDTSRVRKVAEITGGLYQEATDGDSLKNIYEKIDALERSEFKQTFRRYRELYHVPLLGALACLVLEIVLGCTWFRRIP